MKEVTTTSQPATGMDLESVSTVQTKNSSRKNIRVTLNDNSIQGVQKNIASATIFLPLLGFIAAVVLAFQYGVSQLDIILLVSMYILTSLGIEFGYHRLLCHRAFKTTKFIKYLSMVLGQMAGEGGVIYWVATHRRHHIHSDTIYDPHSPHICHTREQPENLGLTKGIIHAQWGWMVNDKVTNSSAFTQDLFNDPVTRWINDLYVPIVMLGVLIPGLIGGIVTQSWLGFLTGFLWGGLARMFFVTNSTWLSSSFAHRFGGKPYETHDHSANNFWCALPTFGASWQNNHHAYPLSAKLGFQWWQIDLTWYVIWVLEKFGLATRVTRPNNKRLKSKLKTV